MDEASRVAEELPLKAKFSDMPVNPFPLELGALLNLAQGNLEEAVDDLLVLGADLEDFGFLNPAAIPWRQEVVPALATLDRTGEAEAIVASAEELARAFGAPHVIGTVLRARGLIEPRERQIETLRSSVELLEEYGPPHELARSVFELGAALRRNRQRSESREPLRRAMELAHRAGAGGIETRAREELAAAGSRPRTKLEITSREELGEALEKE